MILERDDDLAALGRLLDEAALNGGRTVLIRGEAGIGKTALVQELARQREQSTHVLLGVCDDYSTPQPLGPFWDVARFEPELASALSTGQLRDVFETLLELLSRRLRPTVLILEDTQWADEATLDVIMFLARRIARTNGLLVLTYRDGEVDTDHPLRQIVGRLAPEHLVRINLGALTPDAVGRLAGLASPGDTAAIMSLTGGNPLFVTEVIADADSPVPASVQESVLERVSRLPPSTRAILDFISIAPGHADREVAERVLQPAATDLDELVERGFIVLEPDVVRFRHELQRRAVEAALSTAQRADLNRLMLEAIREEDDPARLVHHAREAGDEAAIAEYGPAAARAAAAIGSHREAIAHFRALEPHLRLLAPAARAEVCVQWAREEFFADNKVALEILDRAVMLCRESGDDKLLARTLTAGIRMNELYGRPDKANRFADEAVEILERRPPGAELADALGQQAWLRLMQGDDDVGGIELADRAIAIADAVGAHGAKSRALMTKGSILHSSKDREAIRLVEEALRIAQHAGEPWEEVYALINLGGLAGDVRDLERGIDMTRRARSAAAGYELRSEETYATAMLSEMLLWKGDWGEAENLALEVLGSHPHAEMLAWRILGTLQSRRGRHEAAQTLERMWHLAVESGELQNIDPAASALAEHAWLRDRLDDALRRDLVDVVERGLSSGYVWPSGALVFWTWKLGLVTEVPESMSPFYHWIITGEWERAAEFWEKRGVGYEHALALMHGDDDARIEAVRVFEGLGATAAAARLRSQLAGDGIRVPRGLGRSTRDHAAGLTARQAEVLDLLADGLTNADIADRLFLSRRTVENHVAAILMKLDVPDRNAAVERATADGLITTGHPAISE